MISEKAENSENELFENEDLSDNEELFENLFDDEASTVPEIPPKNNPSKSKSGFKIPCQRFFKCHYCENNDKNIFKTQLQLINHLKKTNV